MRRGVIKSCTGIKFYRGGHHGSQDFLNDLNSINWGNFNQIYVCLAKITNASLCTFNFTEAFCHYWGIMTLKLTNIIMYKTCIMDLYAVM